MHVSAAASSTAALGNWRKKEKSCPINVRLKLAWNLQIKHSSLSGSKNALTHEILWTQEKGINVNCLMRNFDPYEHRSEGWNTTCITWFCDMEQRWVKKERFISSPQCTKKLYNIESENHSLLSDITKNGLIHETLSTSQEKGIAILLLSSEKFNPCEHPPEQWTIGCVTTYWEPQRLVYIERS